MRTCVFVVPPLGSIPDRAPWRRSILCPRLTQSAGKACGRPSTDLRSAGQSARARPVPRKGPTRVVAGSSHRTLAPLLPTYLAFPLWLRLGRVRLITLPDQYFANQSTSPLPAFRDVLVLEARRPDVSKGSRQNSPTQTMRGRDP